MEKRLEFKPNKSKGTYDVGYYEGRNSKATYHNILSPSPNQIAAILIDLEVTGLPIFEAVKIYLNRRDRKDWMGI